MAITPLRRVRSDDNVVRQLQDAVGLVFQDISGRQLIDGHLIEDLVIKAGTPLNVEHKLQRNFIGYVIVRRDANATIWDSVNNLPYSILTLNSSADVKVTLWVF